MFCPKCNTFNDDHNAFCVNCGEIFRSSSTLPPTILPNFTPADSPTEVFPATQNQNPDYVSEPTVYGGHQPNINQSFNVPQTQFNQSNANFNPSAVGFNPSIPFLPPQPQPAKSRAGLWIGIGAFVLLIFACGIAGAIYFLKKPEVTAEKLPDHLGLFFQNTDKTSVDELKKQDFANALEGKDKILKDDSMPEVENKPNLILYSDGKDIPLNDLKLIQLDTVKNDGTMKQIDFKATPIEGKPEMKRLWFTDVLAKGKYAFALFEGFFDDGKHKFWVFQVKNSDKTNNDDLLKEFSLSLKNKTSTKNTNTDTETTPKPTPKPTVAPPVGSRTGFSNTNNVVIRSAPSLGAQKIGNLRSRQKVYVLGYSNNYDYWNGLEGNWTHIQTESGQRGWVFSPFISY